MSVETLRKYSPFKKSLSKSEDTSKENTQEKVTENTQAEQTDVFHDAINGVVSAEPVLEGDNPHVSM